MVCAILGGCLQRHEQVRLLGRHLRPRPPVSAHRTCVR